MRAMKRIIPVILLAAVTVAAFADSLSAVRPVEGSIKFAGDAFLQPLQKRDSVLIADQMAYGFYLKGIEEGTDIMLPEFKSADSIEVISPWTLDTLRRDRKDGTMDIRGHIVLTSFDAGRYLLPDIRVVEISGGRPDTLLFRGKELDVRTMPLDTATFKVHDIKGQIRYPLTFAELLPYIVAFYIIAILTILSVCLVKIARSRKKPEEISSEPPYIVALRKLDRYRGNKLWAPESQKLFYSGVTDVLREYIARRYGFGAMEMTTDEIFRKLSTEEIDKSLYSETKELFLTSDLVKFAKSTVSDEENIKAVPVAVRFVTSTWRNDDDASDLAKKSSSDATKNGSIDAVDNVGGGTKTEAADTGIVAAESETTIEKKEGDHVL